MRIAVFYELTNGGAKTVATEYIKELEKNHTVDLYYVDTSEDQNIKRKNNTYFYKWNAKKWSGNNWRAKLYKDTIELVLLYFLHRKIASDITSNNYDSILVHPSQYTQTPFLLRFLKNNIYYCQEPLRIVYDSRFSPIDKIPFPKKIYEKINRYIRKQIDKSNISHAGKILVNSQYSKSIIEKVYKKKTSICYLGVDTKKFMDHRLKRKYDILFIGNKKRVGEYDLLTKMFLRYDLSMQVKTIFRDISSSRITDKELIKLYNTSKVFLTLSHNEPFGLTALESMACGTPVIAVNEGGYKESLINGVTGMLVERNPDSLYKAITFLLNNNLERDEMGKKARKHVQSHWSIIKSTKTLVYYLKLCKQKK